MRLATLSHQWRYGPGKVLAQRRVVIGLSLATMSSPGLITLYQVGIIRQLPEPRLPWFDAEKVTASDEAYAMFSTPDAVLGLASYAVTTVLAAKGGQDRARTRPWIPLALAAKVAFDAIQEGKRTRDAWTKHGMLCSWCLLATGAMFVTAPLVIPRRSRPFVSWIAEDRKADWRTT